MDRRAGPRPALLLAAIASLTFAGCATPGPLHVYTLDGAASVPRVIDRGADGTAAEVPSFLETGDRLIGFAYDPFTDHFFLRLAPGHRIRVVDRPARAIKRELAIDAGEVVHAGPADLAVRPRDGHLFLLQPDNHAVLETTRLGKPLRTIALAGDATRPLGLALDGAQNHLLVLGNDGRRIRRHDMQGAIVGEFALAATVDGSLAFDSEKRELYAPLRDRVAELGVFDEQGKLLRTAAAPGRFVDVGPRSLIRVF